MKAARIKCDLELICQLLRLPDDVRIHHMAVVHSERWQKPSIDLVIYGESLDDVFQVVEGQIIASADLEIDVVTGNSTVMYIEDPI